MDFIKQLFSILFSLAMLICVISLTSCHIIRPTQPIATDQSIRTLEQAAHINREIVGRTQTAPVISSNLNSALMPPLSHYVNPGKDAEVRFDVAAAKVPAKDFFMSLVSGTKYNMVVDNDIKGDVTLDLKNVTIKESLEAVKDLYGYDYEDTSYGYAIHNPKLTSEVFHVNYLDIQRAGRSFISVTTGQVSNKVGTTSSGGTDSGSGSGSGGSQSGGGSGGDGTISSIETKSDPKFWSTMQQTLLEMLDSAPGRSVSVNPLAGVIVVKAYPSELRRIENYLTIIQTSLDRQIVLEAKVLEVTLNDTYQAGIDWSVMGQPSTNTAGIEQTGNALLEAVQSMFAIQFKGNFKALVKILQQQGNVQVLSSPRIATVNNQKAVIKVGSDEFFVTGISTTQNVVGQTATAPTQSVALTPFFSGITLDITPEISGDSEVVLHIHPSVSQVTTDTKTIQLGNTTNATGAAASANNLVLPLALSTIRESDNIVHAQNGQVVVIGGLMQNKMQETLSSTPWISKIPFLGHLFRTTSQTATKSELVILVRPIIASNIEQTKFIEEQQRAFQRLRRPFHAGALSKVFGNEAEREDRT